MAKGKRVANPTKDTAPDFIKSGGNRGSEEVGFQDITLARVTIIQDLSPQHKKSKPEYIEGAEVGLCFNTVTLELYGDSITIIPAYFKPEWVIWRTRAKGGGLISAHDSVKEANEVWKDREDKDDLEVVDTGQQFVLIVKEDGTHEEAVLSMAKSQQKPSRQLNTLIRLAGGDRFSRVYKLSVIEAQNQASQDYFNWKVEQLGFVQDQLLYKKAESMYDAVVSGRRGISYEEDPADA